MKFSLRFSKLALFSKQRFVSNSSNPGHIIIPPARMHPNPEPLPSPIQTASSLLLSLHLPPTPITSRQLHLPSSHTATILHFDSLPSTMLLSQNWPQHLLSATHSFCFVTDQQTQGQGQHSNTWSSPQGNIYMTVLVELCEMDLVGISTIVGLALAQNVSQARIKWINDVVVDGKKVAGVLVRSESMKGSENFRVEIGIGVNVKVAPLPTSTCLEEVEHKTLDLNETIDSIIRQLFKNLEILKKQGSGAFTKEIQERLLYLNQKVYIYNQDLTKIIGQGIFTKLSPQYYAILTTEPDKKQLSFPDGRMRNILNPPP